MVMHCAWLHVSIVIQEKTQQAYKIKKSDKVLRWKQVGNFIVSRKLEEIKLTKATNDMFMVDSKVS